MRSGASLSGVLLLTFISQASALNVFTADFDVRRPDSNGAVVRGTIAYDGPGYRYRYDYTARTYHEIFKYRSDFGTDARANVDQWHYQVGQYCEAGCRADRIDHAFPVYFNDPTKYQATGGPSISVAGKSCAPYAPLVSSPLTQIWFAGDGTLCRALWSDGAEYTFSNVVADTDAVFTEPDDCRCTDRLDLVIMIDRSASITQKDYASARDFARKFARRFTISPSQVNVAIMNFDVDASPFLLLPEGTSLANVDAALNTASCACQDTLAYNLGAWNEVPKSKTAPCCARRSSLSKALDRASQYFTANGRVGSRRAVLLITDGRHNTLADFTPCKNGVTCNKDLTAAIERIVAAHQGVGIFGVGMGSTDNEKMSLLVGGRYEKLTNTSYFNAERSFYFEGAVGCSDPVYYCDPDGCGGLCECAECRPPSACDSPADFCQVAVVDPLSKACDIRPRNCASSNPLTCTINSCDSALGACVSTPLTCPSSSDPCFTTACDPQQDLCVQACPSLECGTGQGVCGSSVGCETADDCADNNPCTQEQCMNGLCLWPQVNCNDNDFCTTDSCDGTGCRNVPAPPSICDDGVSCTTDVCSNNQCINTAIECDDNLACTTDSCNVQLGHCVYEPIVCPVSPDNCTLTFCNFGACDERALCPQDPRAGF
jgi:hypothetical protein